MLRPIKSLSSSLPWRISWGRRLFRGGWMKRGLRGKFGLILHYPKRNIKEQATRALFV